MTMTSVQNLVDKTGISRYLVTKALNELHIEIGHHLTKISAPQMTKLEATFKAIKTGNKALKTRSAKPAAKPKAMKPAKPAANAKPAKPAAKPMAAKPMAKVKPAASALKPEANSAPKLQDTDGLHD